MINKKFIKINLETSLFFLTLSIILLIGIIARLWNLDYVNGLWFDEYCSYDVCNNSFPFGVIESSVKGNVEPPPFIILY